VLGYANIVQQIGTAFATFAGIRRGRAGRYRSAGDSFAIDD